MRLGYVAAVQREEAEPDNAPSFPDRYPSVARTQHHWRSRRANAIAALVLLAAIAIVVLVLAVVG